MPLEQRKKHGFCKFYNILGHKTSQCELSRDLVQNAMKEEIDPKVEEALVDSIDVLMVYITDDTKEAKFNLKEQMKVVFPKAMEDLIDVLNRFKLMDFEVMLWPCCSVVPDKEALKELEKKPTLTSQRKVVDKANKNISFSTRGDA